MSLSFSALALAIAFLISMALAIAFLALVGLIGYQKLIVENPETLWYFYQKSWYLAGIANAELADIANAELAGIANAELADIANAELADIAKVKVNVSSDIWYLIDIFQY